jgi:hypothetical protein
MFGNGHVWLQQGRAYYSTWQGSLYQLTNSFPTKRHSDIATAMIYGVASFRVGPSLYVIPKYALQEIMGPRRPIASFQRFNTLNGPKLADQHLSPPTANPYVPTWLKSPNSPSCSHYDWVDIGGRVQQKYYIGLTQLNLGVPMGSLLRPWV